MTTTVTKNVRERSPDKPKYQSGKHTTEYQTKYTRKSSPDTRKTDNKLFQHTDLLSKKDISEKISEYQSSYSYNERRTSSSEYSQTTSQSRSRSVSPDTKPFTQKTVVTKDTRDKSESKTTKSPTKPLLADLKKTAPVSKAPPRNDQPEWVTQNILKKVTTVKQSPVTKVSTTSSRKTQETKVTSSSSGKQTKSTDAVISSYGVGPMDDDGTPLFGLKALRAQNKSESKGNFNYIFI